MNPFLLLASDDPLEHVIQHTVWDLNPGGGLWSFPIVSNHVLMQIVAAFLLVAFLPSLIAKRAGRSGIERLIPTGAANAIESFCDLLRKHIFEPNLGRFTNTFAPYLWSLFFFILTCNLLGMIPIAAWFFWVPGHWVGGTATGNIYTTATLAIATLLMIVVNGLRYNGMGFVKHFFMGPPYIAWFVALLEIAGLFFKTMALAVRLFANMLAGHMILAVLLSFIPMAFVALPAVGGWGVAIGVVLASVAFNFLEILVAFLHAFIFTTLTAVFLGQAVNIHHDDDHESAHHGEHAAAH